MDYDNFIILNFDAPSADASFDLETFGGILSVNNEERLVSRSSRTASREIIAVESGPMSEKDAADINRDPGKIALRDMPVTLIEPLSTRSQNSGQVEASALKKGPTWGVNEVLGSNPADVSGAGVSVAVLDTGINPKHPAFANIEFSADNRRDFTNTEIDDENGHGTHCAGTIFGRDVDGTRIGVAKGISEIYIAKVLDKFGRGSASALLKALTWAQLNEADIISMSLGFDFPRMRERLVQNDEPPEIATSKALKAYRDNLKAFDLYAGRINKRALDFPGSVIVAASGNESMRERNPNFVIDVSIPAAANDEIISVGAVRNASSGLHVADFSNINPRICAPGVGIWSADMNGKLRPDSGTSMACPHVAGIAALWWEWVVKEDGRPSARRVRELLVASSSRDKIDGWNLPDFGNGCVLAPQKN